MLEATDLWVAPPGRGGDAVVRGVSLSLSPGEWVAVTGPNGAGKTSLALAISGLWPIERGRLEIDGLPFGPSADLALRSRIAAVLQDPEAQLLQATVGDELAFAARNLGRPEADMRRQVSRCSDRLGLGPLMERDPRTLSGGFQQLVLIAAAIVARPRILVLDEAGAHLDGAARARVIDLLGEEVLAGASVLWVTQEPDEIEVASRVLSLGHAESPVGRREAQALTAQGAGKPLLDIEIAPWDGALGPHVACDRRLAITVPERGVLALEGPNGCGKSVTLAAAALAASSPQVTVRWGGAAGAASYAGQFPELQIFQERVLDEVTFAAVRRGMPRDEAVSGATAMFDRLGLPHLRSPGRSIWDLSSGEKRLVGVIGALLAPARLVVLDEPSCGIDPRRREPLAALVRERGERDAVLLASQDRAWLDRVGSRRVQLGLIAH